MGSMETGWNSPPAPSKTPEPMVTKLSMGDEVGDPYPCEKFHNDPIRGFFTPPPRPSAGASAYNVTRLVSFFGGSSSSLQPRPLHRSLRSIRQVTSFRARMCLLVVPKTKFYISTPISPQNRKFWANFDGTSKFSAQKGFNNGDAHLQTTINRHRSPMKDMYWIGKSGSANPNMGLPATPYQAVSYTHLTLPTKRIV